MRLYAALARLVRYPDEPEVLWTRASPVMQPHVRAIEAYSEAGGDTYVMRVAEFEEVSRDVQAICALIPSEGT